MHVRGVFVLKALMFDLLASYYMYDLLLAVV